ncbi:MAG: S8 family serine peptidase [Bacteroidota bacterium]
MKKLSPLAFFLFCALLLTAQNDTWMHKVDGVLLDRTANGESTEFLLVLSKKADLSAAHQLSTKEEKAIYVYQQLRQTAQESQKPLLQLLDQIQAPYQSLLIANVIKTQGNRTLLQRLAKRADVAKVLDNPSIRMEGPVEQMASGSRAVEWGIEKVNADEVWAMGYRGAGVTVGGQDTGYEWEHPALKAQYRGYDAIADTADHNYHWHDAIHELNPLNNDQNSDPNNNPCGLDSTVPCDDNNHGTHTMGTMIGVDGENEIGVAPEADWCACRNMERGWGTPFTYLECFEWFLAPTDLNDENPDPTRAPHVIANSWSCPEMEGCNPSNFDLLNTAVVNLKTAGTVVVVSAGNAGSSCSTVSTPAAIFEASFSVGATNSSDTIAGFSSRGPVLVDNSGRMKPNVSAPGVGVRSAIRGGGYASFSGTSMAGPHVAGVVALMISANPDLAGQVEQIETILEQTALGLTTDQECGGVAGTTIPNHTYGHGRIDALAAVEEALSLITTSTEESTFAQQIKVFPNPFSNALYLEVRDWTGDFNLELTDINGRLIFQRKLEVFGGERFDLPLGDLSTGIYFYRVLAVDQVLVGKIIKE